MSDVAVAEPPPVSETALEPALTAVDQIMEMAMKLSGDERAELLDRLDETVADENMTPEEKAALLAELDRRMEEHLRDPSSSMDINEFFAELDAEDAAERAKFVGTK